MTLRLPDEFAALRRLLINGFNPLVNESFRNDVEDIDVGGWDTASEEQQLKRLLKIQPDDTVTIATIRLLTFVLLRQGIKTDNDQFFAIPVSTYYESNVLKPQVQLLFREKKSAQTLAKRTYPLEMRLSFRLMKESNEVTKTEVNQLIDRIASVFLTPPKPFDKGRIYFSYKYKERGYNLQFLAKTESEAKDLISDILSLRNEVPRWELLGKSEKTEKNWNAPTGSTVVLGNRIKDPERRPEGRVYLRRAELTLYPQKPMKIVDTTSGGGIIKNYV